MAVDILIYFPIVLLLALLALGIPVAYALLLAGMVGIAIPLGLGPAMGIYISVPYDTAASWTFSTIPMFILMAEFLSKSDITNAIYRSFYYWTSHIRGGLAIATTIANGGMAALTGSSTASAATMASIAVPEMKKYGYSDRVSMGTVSASGTFAAMIPPSLALILYGVYTGTSIANLFIAGIIPGILTLIGYVVVIKSWTLVNPEEFGETAEKFSMSERLSVMKPLLPALLLIVLVLGGLYGGVVTPTEAGGLGAAGALIVAVSFTDIGWGGLDDAVSSTVHTTTMIFLIIIGATMFGRYLAVTGITSQIITIITESGLNNLLILMFLLALYIFLGMFLSMASVLLLTLPITFPLVTQGLGFDAIWFGILVVKTAEIGLVTPPLGMNVYVATSAVNVDIEQTFAGAARFLVADVAVLLLLLAFPEIALWLPG